MARKRDEKHDFLDWRTLSDFIAVVESGTMSAAALRLSLTQSAISKAISELEADLGVKLIDRSVRPVRLTRAGSILYDRASRILHDMRRLRGAVRTSSETKLPNLRVGVVESVMVTGPSLVRELQNLASEVQVVSGLTPELSRRLIQRELDVLITSDPMENVGNVAQRPLFREPFILVIPASRRDLEENLSLKAVIAALPLVRYTTRSIIGVSIERHLRRLTLDPSRFLEFDHSTSVLDMVGAGLGCAITTPLCLLQSKIDRDLVQLRPMPGPKFSRTLCCTTPGDEIPELGHRIHQIAQKCLRQRVTELTETRYPWLKDQFVFESP